MYKNAPKILPKVVKNNYKALLRYCDIQIDYDTFIGFMFLFGLGIAFTVSLNAVLFFSYSINASLLVFILTYALFEIVVYVLLLLRADSRGKYVENILPDALLLMSMNIKSGITADRALIMSALPEFGPLRNELNKAGKQILAGKPIKHALLNMTSNVKSKLFDRTIRLIVEGIESGGELSDLLRQTAEEIQSTKATESEVHANVLMYAIFIFFAAGIGAPILFGISTYLVGAVGKQFPSFSVVTFSQQAAQGQFNISPGFLVTFALLSLTISSFFGGLIIGIVKDGDAKAGIKFIPILFVLSFFVFFTVRAIVGNVLPTFG